MISIFRFGRFLGAVIAVYLAVGTVPAASEVRLGTIKLPPGFHIALYAEKVPNARQMALGANGVLFTGSRDAGAGQVYAIVDTNKDGKADEVHVIIKGLKQPSGVAFHEGALYVADIGRIVKFENIESTYKDTPQPIVVTEEYPMDTWHGWKFIAFGPDGKLYVPVGAPCNICEPKSEIYATITRINPDGSGREIFAKGVRNTVGFDWHPVTKELWFTDNGRDSLGPDLPPDELNRAPGPGLHFGFPHWFGKSVPDPKFGEGHKADEFTPPAQDLDPHVAAIGMRFYTGKMFPESYRNRIFIAEHGSWDRKPPASPSGYRITTVTLDKDGNATAYEPFATGWMQTGKAWGRPADVLVMPDGALLVSDDAANCVYRITYSG